MLTVAVGTRASSHHLGPVEYSLSCYKSCMPELPEVQTVVNSLRPTLLGRRILAVSLGRQDIVEPAGIDLPALLTKRSIRDIHRRGKRIVFTLDDAQRFYIHLGMTGRLTVGPETEAVAPHTHMQIRFDDASVLRFNDARRFGGIWWLGSGPDDDNTMGPEPLELRPAQLAERLKHTKRAIKSALLDQSLIAGLGNIYADESLFSAGIHPLMRADRLTPVQSARLTRAIKATLRRALNHRGSTLRDYRDANGEAGNFQKLHRVYGREAEPCWKCKTPLQRIVIGGRSTHFCPACQPGKKEKSREGAKPRRKAAKEDGE
jgi:formamidopyrimidine-DNA glycosylase